MENMHLITRRSFIAGATAFGALSALGLGGLTSCASGGESTSGASADVEEMDCDVLVCGGGISGSLAALSALDKGADVILIEKQNTIGGSAALSSGFMVTVDNDNFGKDIDDSLDTTMDVLMTVHDQSPDKEYPNVDRLRNTFAQQGATIDFMLGLGMTAEFTKKSTAVTAWEGKGAGMMEALATIMDEKGVRVILDCAASDFVMEEGAVVGVNASSKGKDVVIKSKKVILACGGASHNNEILESYMPTYPEVDLIQLSAVGNTGDGFAMMKQVGAQSYPTMVFEGGGVDVDGTWKGTWGDVKLSTGDKLAFDAAGKRFTNEAPAGSGVSQMLTYYMVENGSPAYYWLHDASNADTKALLDKGVELGCVFYGETVDALAKQIDVDAATLSETIERYQGFCEAGADDDFAKDAKSLVPYAEEGGYYAVLYRPVSWGTIGGFVTDETGHVCDEGGNATPNLFAVGEMSNREFFSDFYVGGNSLALNSTMGRIAGATAVAEMA